MTAVARRVLAIESATDWLSVALMDGEDVVELRRSDTRMQHAAALLPTIDAVLSAADTDLDAIDALAISTGPGSFTSLRIGLATVKGLAFRREIEAVGVSTLEAMALSGMESEPLGTESETVALLDARRGEWYAGSWAGRSRDAGLPRPRLAEGLYAPAALAAAIQGPIRIVAPESGAWLEAFEAAGVSVSSYLSGEAARPGAEWVGRLGRRRLEAGEGLPARLLGARYLRRAEAEAKRLGRPVESGEVARLEPPDGAA
jgi:tRNA threonylcarbamoyladenosine biosynthesis protein TsaB